MYIHTHTHIQRSIDYLWRLLKMEWILFVLEGMWGVCSILSCAMKIK